MSPPSLSTPDDDGFFLPAEEEVQDDRKDDREDDHRHDREGEGEVPPPDDDVPGKEPTATASEQEHDQPGDEQDAGHDHQELAELVHPTNLVAEAQSVRRRPPYIC